MKIVPRMFPSLAPRRYQSWHGWLFAAVLVLAVVLGVVQWVADDGAPSSDIPAVTWENIIVEERADDSDPLAPMNGGSPTDEQTPSIDGGGTGVVEPEEPAPTPEEEDAAIPSEFNLAVPFTSQAPFGVWDALHEDACEEASMYMVAEYFGGRGEGKIDPAVADEAITAMVQYAETELGHGLSISAAQAVELIETYYEDLDAFVVEDPTAEDIKAYVAAGYPVIMPAAGRALGNPNFSGEGPLYHMLVIRGYDETHFITNDPGTRLGQGYTYSHDVIMDALADWTGDGIDKDAKRIVVMQPAQ